MNTNDPMGLKQGDWWDLPANLKGSVEIAKEELSKPNQRGHNDKSDAIRHAEWSRRMSEEIGPGTSLLVGVGHEIEGFVKGQPWDEAMMDIHNNAEGRAAARENRKVNSAKLRTSPKQGSLLNPYKKEKYFLER